MATLKHYKIFSCSECQRKFESQRALSVHCTKTHKTKEIRHEFACPDCRKRGFSSIVALNTHHSKAHPENHRKFMIRANFGLARSSKKLRKK